MVDLPLLTKGAVGDGISVDVGGDKVGDVKLVDVGEDE